MCKYCDPNNVYYHKNARDAMDGSKLPLFRKRLIDEFENDADCKDNTDSVVVGIVGDKLVLRRPDEIGWNITNPMVTGITTINYCPVCGRKLN